MYSSEAAKQIPDDSLDFVYIDARFVMELWLSCMRQSRTAQGARQSNQWLPHPPSWRRHDYCSVSEDLALYWPKLKPGGIFAGAPDTHALNVAVEEAALLSNSIAVLFSRHAQVMTTCMGAIPPSLEHTSPGEVNALLGRAGPPIPNRSSAVENPEMLLSP